MTLASRMRGIVILVFFVSCESTRNIFPNAVAKKILKSILVAGFASTFVTPPATSFLVGTVLEVLTNHHRALVAWFSLLMLYHLRPSFISTIVNVLVVFARIQITVSRAY